MHRHGICHGCMDIIRVKFCFPGVKFSFECSLLVVKSRLAACLCCFAIFLGGLLDINGEKQVV